MAIVLKEWGQAIYTTKKSVPSSYKFNGPYLSNNVQIHCYVPSIDIFLSPSLVAVAPSASITWWASGCADGIRQLQSIEEPSEKI